MMEDVGVGGGSCTCPDGQEYFVGELLSKPPAASIYNPEVLSEYNLDIKSQLMGARIIIKIVNDYEGTVSIQEIDKSGTHLDLFDIKFEEFRSFEGRVGKFM